MPITMKQENGYVVVSDGITQKEISKIGFAISPNLTIQWHQIVPLSMLVRRKRKHT